MKFPGRVFTQEEVETARKLIEAGYKHHLAVEGSPEFKEKAKEALRLIKIANYYDFLRTYIKAIVEAEGLSQLRQDEAVIWANEHTLVDSVEAASYFIQKAQQMKDYLEGKLYYDIGEKQAIERRVAFLEALKNRSEDRAIKERCKEALKQWNESKFL